MLAWFSGWQGGGNGPGCRGVPGRLVNGRGGRCVRRLISDLAHRLALIDSGVAGFCRVADGVVLAGAVYTGSLEPVGIQSRRPGTNPLSAPRQHRAAVARRRATIYVERVATRAARPLV